VRKPESKPRVEIGLPTLSAVALALLLGSSLILSACSPLTIYNTLAPADREGLRASADVPYGEHPRQKLDVYIPATRVTGAPIVVFFYGGSWNSGDKADYAFVGKALASRGFVTVIADYRLVPEVRFPAFLDDGARAVVWAHRNASQFGGDPKRLFVVGHSAGAYNASMIALDGRYLQALGASQSIIRGAALLAGPYDFLPLEVDSTKAAFGQAKDLNATQPINFVTRTSPPMFLATGSDDTVVLPRNSKALAAKLNAQRIPVTVRTYGSLSHVGIMLALSLPFRGQAPVLDDLASFIIEQR
jgi:acetyl esterase/lipase